MTNKQIWTCVLLTAALTVSLATSGVVLGKGKPKPPPPPAIVNYAIQRVPMPADYSAGIPWPRNINVQGEIAGYYSSLDGGEQPYYVDGNGLLTNLNDMALDPDFDVPAGWYVYAATDINDWGDVSGALARLDDPAQLRGFVLELRPENGDPRLHLIPDGDWSHTYACRINDAGEVLGRGDAIDSYIYRPPLHGLPGDASVVVLPFDFDAFYSYLNNPVGNSPAQVLTDDGRLYTLGDAAATDLTIPINSSIGGFNDLGLFCGWRYVAGKGNKTSQVGYIYDGQFNDVSSLQRARDLNENADLVGPASGRPTLVHADHGVIDLDSDGSVYLVSERGIVGTDPAVDDFPVIVGTSGQDLLILRPVPVIQP